MQDRTGRTRRREATLAEDRPAPGDGFAADEQRPRLEGGSLELTLLSCLNRRVRTRMLGGVGAGEGDLPGYPIGHDSSAQKYLRTLERYCR